MVADNNEHCARLEGELASYQAITRRLDAYTQQLETEARELRREAGLGQAILDALPDPILVTDQAGRMLRRNKAAAWLFSLPQETESACATAISCLRCFGEECPLRHDLAPGERQLQITGPDGVLYTFALSAVPLPEGVLLLHYRDMTELAAVLDEESG
ncbi:MAG: PAS domain-containing protein [Armatimonadota bacterium]